MSYLEDRPVIGRIRLKWLLLFTVNFAARWTEVYEEKPRLEVGVSYHFKLNGRVSSSHALITNNP